MLETRGRKEWKSCWRPGDAKNGRVAGEQGTQRMEELLESRGRKEWKSCWRAGDAMPFNCVITALVTGHRKPVRGILGRPSSRLQVRLPWTRGELA
eukprot:gene2555-3627_t